MLKLSASTMPSNSPLSWSVLHDFMTNLQNAPWKTHAFHIKISNFFISLALKRLSRARGEREWPCCGMFDLVHLVGFFQGRRRKGETMLWPVWSSTFGLVCPLQEVEGNEHAIIRVNSLLNLPRFLMGDKGWSTEEVALNPLR